MAHLFKTTCSPSASQHPTDLSQVGSHGRIPYLPTRATVEPDNRGSGTGKNSQNGPETTRHHDPLRHERLLRRGSYLILQFQLKHQSLQFLNSTACHESTRPEAAAGRPSLLRREAKQRGKDACTAFGMTSKMNHLTMANNFPASAFTTRLKSVEVEVVVEYYTKKKDRHCHSVKSLISIIDVAYSV